MPTQLDSLRIRGGQHGRIRAVSAAYTVQPDDYILLGNATSAGFTITLPAVAAGESAVDDTGRVLIVVKTDSGGNAVTVDGASSETINGSANVALSAQYACVQFFCTGSAWICISGVGATSAASLSVSGNATVGGTLGVTGATTLSSTLAAGNTTVTGTLDVTTTARCGGAIVDADPGSGTASCLTLSNATGTPDDTAPAAFPSTPFSGVDGAWTWLKVYDGTVVKYIPALYDDT